MNFERLQKEQYNIGRKDGYLEGEQKGEIKKEKFLAERMKARGMHDDELAELLDITPERLREILSVEHAHEDSEEYKEVQERKV